MTEDESQAAAEDLAKRLRLLMDVAVAESGTEPTYSQIANYLHERGTNLSRSRWSNCQDLWIGVSCDVLLAS